jgi:hypothetical protein
MAEAITAGFGYFWPPPSYPTAALEAIRTLVQQVSSDAGKILHPSPGIRQGVTFLIPHVRAQADAHNERPKQLQKIWLTTLRESFKLMGLGEDIQRVGVPSDWFALV